MIAPTQQVPRIHTAAVPRVRRRPAEAEQLCTGRSRAAQAATLLLDRTKKLRQCQRKKAAAKLLSPDVPARNTRVEKRETEAKEAVRARPATKGIRGSTKAKYSSQGSCTKQRQRGRHKKNHREQYLEQILLRKKLNKKKRMRILEHEVQHAMPI